MPNLRIETNVSAEAIKDLNTFLSELSKAVSTSTGKPEQYVVVQVDQSLNCFRHGEMSSILSGRPECSHDVRWLGCSVCQRLLHEYRQNWA